MKYEFIRHRLARPGINWVWPESGLLLIQHSRHGISLLPALFRADEPIRRCTDNGQSSIQPTDTRDRGELAGCERLAYEARTHLLATLASCPTAEGEILEIGTYRGRSAIVLGCASAVADSAPITAIDPLFNTSGQTPEEAETELRANLRQANVSDRININVMSSQDYLPQMGKKLRLLWVDGDHSYEGALFDIEGYSRFLVDGGVIACHDILTPFGCTRAFKELVVENPHFGPVKFCGSIGFAQYHEDPERTKFFCNERQTLTRRLDRLCSLTERATASKFYRAIYRIYRSRIPHGSFSPEKFLSSPDWSWKLKSSQHEALCDAA